MGRRRHEKGQPLTEQARRESRLAALSCRPLMAADIPNEPWQDDYARYQLREDGALVVPGLAVELGFVQATGKVAWARC